MDRPTMAESPRSRLVHAWHASSVVRSNEKAAYDGVAKEGCRDVACSERWEENDMKLTDEQRHRLGNAIRQAREKSGLTQQEVSAGVPTENYQPQLSRIERGVKEPSLAALTAIAKAIGCKPEKLVQQLY